MENDRKKTCFCYNQFSFSRPHGRLNELFPLLLGFLPVGIWAQYSINSVSNNCCFSTRLYICATAYSCNLATCSKKLVSICSASSGIQHDWLITIERLQSNTTRQSWLYETLEIFGSPCNARNHVIRRDSNQGLSILRSE